MMGFDLRPDLIWPEIAVLLTVIAVACVDMTLRPNRRGLLHGVAAVGLAVTAITMMFGPSSEGTAFHGQYVGDAFSQIVKFFLVLVMLSIVLISHPSRQGTAVAGETLMMILCSGLGMMVLASSNSLVVLFVALELATIPLMILTTVGTRTGRSNEAALKFLIAGSVASAFTLFGIALVWAYSGGAMLLTDLRASLEVNGLNAPLAIGLILMLAGLGFKTAIAPFHVWVPDVYQGAPTPITAFLAGGSKAAGFVALVRIGVAAFSQPTVEGAAAIDWSALLATLAALTAIVGNMGAIWQTNLKRLLAHASVGHAGFLLMGLAVLGTEGDQLGLTAMAYYLAFYAVAVAVVFYVMVLVAREGCGDDLKDFHGLGQRNPKLALAMLLGVLSMGGLPPLAGFVGKIMLVAAAVKGEMIFLALAAGFAMVLSIVYTLTILKALYLERSDERAPRTAVGPWEAAALVSMVTLLILFGVSPQLAFTPLNEATLDLLNTSQAAADHARLALATALP